MRGIQGSVLSIGLNILRSVEVVNQMRPSVMMINIKINTKINIKINIKDQYP